MKKEDIHLGDWHRLFIGEAPLEFMLEVVLRTIIIYLVLLITMRLLGKRMNAQLNVTELSLMLMLGGVVSVAMQLPDRGLLLSIFTLACLLVLYRSLNWWAVRNARVEYLVHGELQQVVADGEMDMEAMAQARLSREQLFAQLRKASIQQLGQVKRVYMEANGEFSVYEQTPPKPGLSVLPQQDKALLDAEPADDSLTACHRCGHTEPANQQPPTCPRCQASHWTKAVNKI
jgi:uncharacterized membrane protein YcaP (DUF421 family)